jgi:hypothetical protein
MTYFFHQVKKGKKWMCKMCGEKQSFRKIFAQGSGKECRQVVQKLNMINGNLKGRMLEEGCLQERNNETTGIDVQENEEKCRMNQTSKWNQFVLSTTSDPTGRYIQNFSQQMSTLAGGTVTNTMVLN